MTLQRHLLSDGGVLPQNSSVFEVSSASKFGVFQRPRESPETQGVPRQPGTTAFPARALAVQEQQGLVPRLAEGLFRLLRSKGEVQKTLVPQTEGGG